MSHPVHTVIIVCLSALYTGISAILHGEPDEPKRTVASTSQVDRQAGGDQLGKTKALGGNKMPFEHIYGKASVRRDKNEWDCKACLQGGYTLEEQQPDPDLGQSITPGFRNITVESRPFGLVRRSGTGIEARDTLRGAFAHFFLPSHIYIPTF